MRTLSIAVAVLCVGLAAGFMLGRQFPETETPPGLTGQQKKDQPRPVIQSLAVLPVKVNETSLTDWFAGRVKELNVNLPDLVQKSTKARVVSAKVGGDKDKRNPWQVGQGLGVDAVLTVEIQFGLRYTISGNARLIDVATGQTLWSKSLSLDDQGTDRKGASDLAERMDEFTNVIVKGVRSHVNE